MGDERSGSGIALKLMMEGRSGTVIISQLNLSSSIEIIPIVIAELHAEKQVKILLIVECSSIYLPDDL